MDELHAQDAAGPQQPRVDKGRTIVQVAGPGNAAGLQGRAEPGGHPDHVVVVRPAGAHHGAGVVVDEREKIRLRPADDGAVEGVLCRPRRYADLAIRALLVLVIADRRRHNHRDFRNAMTASGGW